MEKVQVNTLSPSGWMITSHYDKDTTNKVLRTLRDDNGIQIKDFHKLEDFDKDIQKGLKDGTWKFE